MRSILFAAALLIVLTPLTITPGIPQASSPLGTPQITQPSSTGPVTGPPTGIHLTVKSIRGAAFLNFSGTFTVFPATLFLNMTVQSSNSTGTILSVDSGNVTEGIPGLACPSPTCDYRVWKVVSGSAFFSNLGRLTIKADTIETSPPVIDNVWTLYLTGPARLVPTITVTQTSYELFALLFGRIYNNTTTIDLIYLVGIGAKLGDVDMDGRVDISDLATVALSYHTTYGQPNYNPYADVTMHGAVNIQDLAMVAINYGQAY